MADTEKEPVEQVESSPENPPLEKKTKKPRHHRMGAGLVPTLLLASVVLFFAALAFSDRSIPLPEMARAEIERAVNDRMGQAGVSLNHVRVSLGANGTPEVILENVLLKETSGPVLAALNSVRAKLSLGAVLQGQLEPESITLDGAEITLRRASDGGLSIQTSGQGADDPEQLQNASDNVSSVADQVSEFLAADAFRQLQSITAENLVLSVEDARTGRIWQATNARSVLRRNAEGFTVSATSDVFNGTDELAEVQLSVDFNEATGRTILGAQVADMPAGDIALQSPVLSWLGVLDAPISGAVRAEYNDDASLVSLAGTLDIAAGSLAPDESLDPQSFESARAYFSFNPERQRMEFSELALQSERFTLSATGYAYLSELENGWPNAFLGQFNVESTRLDAEGVFENPVELTDLRADMKLTLEPFVIHFGQVAVPQPLGNVTANAKIEAKPDGWHVALDAATPEIAPETVIAYWPLNESVETRRWLVENVKAGRIFNTSASVRKRPDEKPEFAAIFDFEDANVRFMDHMPFALNGAGRGVLEKQEFSLFVHRGTVEAKDGGTLDGAGTVFAVSDIRRKPSIGKIDLRAKGSLTAALSVLNNRPIELLRRANRGLDIASGDVDVFAEIALPLKKRVLNSDVVYDVKADIRNSRSATIVDGRVLTSGSLKLAANPNEVRISGPMNLDGVPVSATWSQPLNIEGSGSVVSGTVALSNEALSVFDIPLPADMVGGRGLANFSMRIPPDGPPELELSSDLAGVGLDIGGLGWSKARSQPGTLRVVADLGASPDIKTLALSANGLDLVGRMRIDEQGTLGPVTFDRVVLDDWLDVQAEITPRGDVGSPAISVTGGRVDLRQLPDGTNGSQSGGARDQSPINFNLDSLVVSEGLQFAPLNGRIDPISTQGLSGTFTGRLNGRTTMNGILAPSNGRTAVRLTSDSAAGVLADAGLTPNARDGTFDIVLRPVAGAENGTYDGQFTIENMRLRKAPAMADLLDAISVVGLIDQLAGPGILFDKIDGSFRLTPERLTLRNAAAVGASLGVSANGVYDISSKQLDIAGVISPIYFVNAIGSVVSRRGEGLFGFNYRMTGPASSPNVGVNPLSIFTPGIFRDLFRRPPPTE